MAKKNYDQLSKDIVKYIGGEENVISLLFMTFRPACFSESKK